MALIQITNDCRIEDCPCKGRTHRHQINPDTNELIPLLPRPPLGKLPFNPKVKPKKAEPNPNEYQMKPAPAMWLAILIALIVSTFLSILAEFLMNQADMKKATTPSDADFKKALDTLFPKYLESAGCLGYPATAFMLHGYKLMGGGYMVSYSSFLLAEECKNLFTANDDDAIDCMKYLAKAMDGVVGIDECTKERYEEICRNDRPARYEKAGSTNNEIPLKRNSKHT